MNEYYIELHDENGTVYGHADHWGNEVYYEDLDEARTIAKSLLRDHIVITRIIDLNSYKVVDFFTVEIRK